MKFTDIRPLLEGGNVEIGDLQANRIDAAQRAEVVPIIDAALKAINASFAKSTGAPLWSPALIRSREYLSGSAFHFFNRAEISDAEFRQVKDTVGDIDTQVNRDQKETIGNWLSKLPSGTQLGPARYIGAKPSGEQFITLWQFPDIVMTDESTGRDVPMNIQIDLELKQFQKGSPSAWSKFSASSAWTDLSLGVKGVFHKYLIQSLAALTERDFLLRKMVGRGKAKTEQDVPTTDTMLSFAVSSAEGGGLRVKYEPVTDERTGKPLVTAGLPVLRARPTTEYEQDIPAIFLQLFGKRFSPKQAKSLESKFWSFSGILDVIDLLLNDSEKQKVLAGFIRKTFAPGAQGLYINDPEKDSREKSIALKLMLEKLKIPAPADLEQLKQEYKTQYKIKKDKKLSEATPDYRRVGIKHIYSPGSSTEMRDGEFLAMIDEIARNSGTLNDMPINLKIDGAGIRFGKDESGKPFMMTSKVNTPLYAENVGDFEKYGRERGQEAEQLERTKRYDQALDVIVNSDFIKKLPADTIVQAEMLFVPMAEQTPAGLKFVNIPYDAKKLGKTLTLVPFSIREFSTGNPRPDAADIKKSLVQSSTPDIKIISNQLQQKNVDVSDVIKPVVEMSAELKSALASRANTPEKQQARQILTQVRQQLSDAIINSPNISGLDKLGKNIEGIVINLPNGQLAKVTSPAMKQAVAAKQKTMKKSSAAPRTAVVAIGSFVGHRGHQQLFDYTVQKARSLNADPYLFMGSAVGQDDPIPIADKVATWKKLYPAYAQNISAVTVAGGSLMQKIKHELINPEPGKPPRYDRIIIMVGEDRRDMPIAQALMKSVNKFPGYEHVQAQLEVTPRGTGMSFTRLRNVLKDPSMSDEEKLSIWKQAFDGSAEFGSQKLPDAWIRHLMSAASQGMGLTEEAAGVGQITAQNTTADVRPGETRRQAAKWGFKINNKNLPPLLSTSARNVKEQLNTNIMKPAQKETNKMKSKQVAESQWKLTGIYTRADEKIYLWESKKHNTIQMENAVTGKSQDFPVKSVSDVQKLLKSQGYQASRDLTEQMAVSWERNRARISEGLALDAADCDRDHEVQMARADLYRAAEYAVALHKMLRHVPDNANLEGWVQAKIVKAADYLASVKHYMEYEMVSGNDIIVDEGKRSSKDIQDDIKKVSNEIDKIVQDGGRVTVNDPLSVKLTKLRAELKKSKKVAESLGGTSAGAIASVVQPLGSVQRRVKKTPKQEKK
jgi:hypothetical protein